MSQPSESAALDAGSVSEETARAGRRGAWGWRIVAAAFIAQAVSIGCTISAFGLFIAPIEADLGASRAQTNLGLSILMLVASGIGPFLGRAIDRGPARAIMLGGVLWTALGLAALSQASSLLQMALVLALMVGVGHASFGPLPAMTILANWFDTKRGTAIGIAATGTTTAGFIMPPVAVFLISNYGWRVALLCYAAGCVVIAAPAIAGSTPTGSSPWRSTRPRGLDRQAA